MLLAHPIIQIAATLLALYALLLGVNRFRRLHLQQKTIFQWQRHVWFGTIALLLWLTGLLVGLVAVKLKWHGFFVTGSHGNKLFIILPLILLSLISGWYMHKRKKQHVILPLIHGSINILLIILALSQVLSGWQVYRAIVLVF